MAYEFVGPGKIIGGEDALASIPQEVTRLKGTSALVVTSAHER